MAIRPLTALVVVPLHGGAADVGAMDLTRILDRGGHRAIVVSRGGRMEGEIAGRCEFVRLDVASHNPIVMLRSAFRAGAARARAPMRSRARAWPRRVERVARGADGGRSAAHHLVQGFSRAEPAQAAVQRDGARRAGDRGLRPDRQADRRALPRRAGADRDRADQHRRGPFRSGIGLGGAARRHPARLGRDAGHQGHSRGRPHAAAARVIMWR